MINKTFGFELDTKEGLSKLYHTSSCKEICEKYQINPQLLYRRLRIFKIPIKPKLQERLTKEWLENNYLNHKLSMSQLATKANVSRKTIIKLFKQFNIKRRSFRDAGLLRSKLISTQMKKQWSDPAYVKIMAKGFTSIKEKMAKLSNDQLGKISKIQKILYGILDDLEVKYESEKILGFWTYDCFLPNHNIIIECQGDYWHSLTKAQTNDTAKATYLEQYFPHIKLKHIWEHEFFCKDRIIELIRYWTGLNKLKLIDYQLENIIIKEISDSDAKLFIAKYHYFGRIGRNSTKYGAYINNILIAICTFANITRNETATRLKLKSRQLRELTRFCIHPSYQKRNLATWFLSRCIKLIKIKFSELITLVSFSDKTYNHTGIIYKASNWILDGFLKPDYWYIDSNGYVMHKKTLWDHANKMGITENNYAIQHGYKRIYGKGKTRYLYHL
jgi:AraC-like DNA-binding protein